MKIAFKSLLIIFVSIVIRLNLSVSFADEVYYPAALLMLDDKFSHNVFVAEKSTHTLYLYENSNGLPKLIKKYQMVTGKKSGNKKFMGDYRTPEGIYYLTEFISHLELAKRYGQEGEIYGSGAFVSNYPNIIDQREGKTGGGIWLHSTNNETRIDKGLDSRGCVVVHNDELKDLSQYIELNKTQIIITHDLNMISKETFENNKEIIKKFVESWLDTWRNEDLDKYISHYSKEEFKDGTRGDYEQFRSYKKNVFWNPGNPKIDMLDLSYFDFGKYALVQFTQHYVSDKIDDYGKKVLYLQKDEFYDWKIVSEGWSKIDDSEISQPIAFKPSMRFFKIDDEATQEKN